MAGLEVDAFLADSVVVAEGKLYVHGAGWNRIIVPAFPAAHDRIGIGLIFRVTSPAVGQHRVELRLEDASGKEVGIGGPPGGGGTPRIAGDFSVGRVPEGDEQLVPLAINLNGMMFQREGEYRFVVSVDGDDLKALRFAVQPRPSEPPAATGGGGYL